MAGRRFLGRQHAARLLCVQGLCAGYLRARCEDKFALSSVGSRLFPDGKPRLFLQVSLREVASRAKEGNPLCHMFYFLVKSGLPSGKIWKTLGSVIARMLYLIYFA